MKLLIASDIHGAAGYCRDLLAAWDREGADRLLLLGDLLYHGPRNDLPPDYAPKEVIALLNARKKSDFLRARQLRHRGGPDGAGISGAGRLRGPHGG